MRTLRGVLAAADNLIFEQAHCRCCWSLPVTPGRSATPVRVGVRVAGSKFSRKVVTYALCNTSIVPYTWTMKVQGSSRNPSTLIPSCALAFLVFQDFHIAWGTSWWLKLECLWRGQKKQWEAACSKAFLTGRFAGQGRMQNMHMRAVISQLVVPVDVQTHTCSSDAALICLTQPFSGRASWAALATRLDVLPAWTHYPIRVTGMCCWKPRMRSGL
eukprot:147321-Chlamydomonas_euryale.AAC.2